MFVLRKQQPVHQNMRKKLFTRTHESCLNETHVYWRWNRQRNRRTCLRLMATEPLQLGHLLTHVVPVEQAPKLYEMVLAGSAGWLGIVYKW